MGFPGTHRPGRRVTIADRRTGQWPRDTRDQLYSTDFGGFATALAFPAALPAGLSAVTRSSRRTVSTSNGFQPPGEVNRLWQDYAAVDGEVLAYDPDSESWPTRSRYLDAEEWGSVRAWDLSGAGTYPPSVAGYTEAHDLDPTGYGWERVYGDLLDPFAPLAIDNGFCRLIWLGASTTGGLAIESWKHATTHYQRVGRVFNAAGAGRARIVELTKERVVVEWRTGPKAMRAILQRGWHGPRLEAYNDTVEEADLAVLEYLPASAEEKTATVEGQFVFGAKVQKIFGTGGPFVLWAQGTADEVNAAATAIQPVAGGAVAGTKFSRSRVIVAQLACEGESPALDPTYVAALSLVDAQAIPVLIGR